MGTSQSKEKITTQSTPLPPPPPQVAVVMSAPSSKKRVRIHEPAGLHESEPGSVTLTLRRPAAMPRRRQPPRGAPRRPATPEIEASISMPFAAIGFEEDAGSAAGIGLGSFRAEKKIAGAVKFLDEFDEDLIRCMTKHLNKRRRMGEVPANVTTDNVEAAGWEGAGGRGGDAEESGNDDNGEENDVSDQNNAAAELGSGAGRPAKVKK